jgi:hypothetical protein
MNYVIYAEPPELPTGQLVNYALRGFQAAVFDNDILEAAGLPRLSSQRYTLRIEEPRGEVHTLDFSEDAQC